MPTISMTQPKWRASIDFYFIPALSAGAVEYADYISAMELDPPPKKANCWLCGVIGNARGWDPGCWAVRDLSAKWSHDLQHFTLPHTWVRWSVERPDVINRPVIFIPRPFMIWSRRYTSNCTYDRQNTKTIYYLKDARKWWLMVNHFRIYEMHTINFQTFFVWAFKIVVVSLKYNILLLYILWDDWTTFMISGSNEQLQQELEYTLLKHDCHSWWISKMQSDSLEERYAIKFCFKLGKMLQKRMEWFRLLLDNVARIKHQFWVA